MLIVEHAVAARLREPVVDHPANEVLLPDLQPCAVPPRMMTGSPGPNRALPRSRPPPTRTAACRRSRRRRAHAAGELAATIAHGTGAAGRLAVREPRWRARVAGQDDDGRIDADARLRLMRHAPVLGLLGRRPSGFRDQLLGALRGYSLCSNSFDEAIEVGQRFGRPAASSSNDSREIEVDRVAAGVFRILLEQRLEAIDGGRRIFLRPEVVVRRRRSSPTSRAADPAPSRSVLPAPRDASWLGRITARRKTVSSRIASLRLRLVAHRAAHLVEVRHRRA